MRQDAYFDQRVTRWTVPHRRAAFAFLTQNLAIPRYRRNVDVQRGAVRKDNRLLATIDGIKKRKIEMIADILAPPAAARAAFAAGNPRKNILGPGVIAEIGKAGVIGVG